MNVVYKRKSKNFLYLVSWTQYNMKMVEKNFIGKEMEGEKSYLINFNLCWYLLSDKKIGQMRTIR